MIKNVRGAEITLLQYFGSPLRVKGIENRVVYKTQIYLGTN